MVIDFKMKDSYAELAAAIIRQAIKDYEKGKDIIRIYGTSEKSNKYQEAKRNIDSVIRFFHSQWFAYLSQNMNGDRLLKKLDENYEKYGQCIPYEKDMYGGNE